jgi:hypothetical protein
MSEHSVDPAWQRLSEFRDRFEALMVPDDQGRHHVERDALLELAGTDPESLVVLCRYYAGLTKRDARETYGEGQAAAALAYAYLTVFADDSLAIWLESPDD